MRLCLRLPAAPVRPYRTNGATASTTSAPSTTRAAAVTRRASASAKRSATPRPGAAPCALPAGSGPPTNPRGQAERAAQVAARLQRQRDAATGGGGPVKSPAARASIDESLTALLTSLLAALSMPTTTKAPRDANPSASSDPLLAVLTQWADEFLATADGSVSSSSTTAKKPTASMTDDAASLAKDLFMEVLAALMPPPPTSPASTVAAAAAAAPPEPSLSRGLLAAAAAAFTAQAAAAKLTAVSGDRDIPVAFGAAASGSGSTDEFDPDAWDRAAKAAAEAADANTAAGAAAAAAVAQTTDAFDPQAWEAAAAAAAAAADGNEATSPAQTASATARGKPFLPGPCWAVATLARALKAATAASAQRLLLLPAQDAARQLLRLPAADRTALLLRLCGVGSTAASGSRGSAWLLQVLSSLRCELGLMEMGVALAALHARFGEASFLAAAAALLPLEDTTVASFTHAPSAAPPPPAGLQALLLHWLLSPQLAGAGLPVLPDEALSSLLPKLAAACSLQHMRAAACWGPVWPLTRLADTSATAGGSHEWQVAQPGLAASLQTQGWCGFSGVPLPWLAHVAMAAAHALAPPAMHGSTSSTQLAAGAAAAANDARAVLRALVTGLVPAEPLLLLLMHHVLQQQPATERQQQVLQLLLEAYCGSSLPTATFADVIHRSFVSMLAGSEAPEPHHQQQVVDAAAALLAALPPQQLRAELGALVGLTGSDNDTPAATLLRRVAAAVAEAADPPQMTVLLSELPAMPHWADTWAAAVSPAGGSFCWARHQLAAALAGLDASSAAQLKAAWTVVAAHFGLQAVGHEVKHRAAGSAAAAAGTSGVTCFAGSLGAFAGEVLALTPLPAAAAHVAALAAVLPADAFARVASALLPAADSAWASPVQRSLLRLYGSLPELPDAPLALQLCAAAAPHLALDQVPALITAAAAAMAPHWQHMAWLPGAAAAAGSDSQPEVSPAQQVELLVAAAISGRDNVAQQHLLAMLVRRLPLPEAEAALRVMQARVELPYAAAEEAAAMLRQRREAAAASRLEGEAVWQVGQLSNEASAGLTGYVAAWTRPSSGGRTGQVAQDSRLEGDRQLVRRLAELIGDIPAAPPAGSWPMDAMHDPSYTAPRLKRCLALLMDWSPSSPAAAATAAQQLSLLAAKRGWSHVDAAAFLERLPLKTALQLLLEAHGSTRSALTRARPKLLASLTEYQGGEQVVQALRELLAADYGGHSVGGFAELLADLRPALAGPKASSTSRDVLDAAAAVGLWPLPNAFVAAMLQVLGPLHAGQAATPGWADEAAALLCVVARQAPAAASARLAEAVAVSLVHGGSSAQQKPDGAATATAAAAMDAWQDSMAALLVALPAAASGTSEWAPLAATVCAAAAEAAGSQAVLQVIAGVFRPSTLSVTGVAVRTAWAAQVAPLLAHLQQQGLLTCGLAWSASGSSACSHPAAAAPASTATPSCISVQLASLLRQLYQTDKALHLQQAAGAVVALAPSLGKALPMAVAQVLSGGFGASRGYGTAGPDAAAAEAALQAATAEASSALRPTGAAVPAATTVAATQLSEALAICHEMLPEAVMTQLMAALAAVLPWSEDGGSGSGKCPAEQEMATGGWQGVTQLLLITSSLLTASCKVWGVDKGTHIAASLIEKLVAAAIPSAVPAAVEASSDGGLRRSSSDGAQHARRAGRVLRRAASTGSSSGVQAAKARAALLQAAGTSSSGSSQAAAAGAALLKAAASTPAAAGDSHAARAEASLLHAAAGDDDTGAGSQASSAEAALLCAGASGLDAAGSSTSQAARAQQALARAIATGSSSATTSASTERVAWATEQLLAATDAWFWPGLTTAKALVQGMMHPAYTHSIGLADAHAASSSSGSRYALAAAPGCGSLAAVLRPEEAAAALLAALPRLASELPADLTAQVLAQSWGLVATADWAAGLERVTAAAADEAQLLELLQKTAAELPLQLESSVALPQACAEVLFSAAARCDSSQHELLAQMLCFLQPASAVQLLLELARPRPAKASSSRDAQMQLLGAVAPGVLRRSQEASSSSSGAAIGQLASTLYQAAVVPRAYLTLLLRPHLDAAQLDTAVRQLGLATGDTAAAATALGELCNSHEGPGWQLPLASFADVLAVALQQANSADFARVSMPEARQGLEADRRRTQQQLLTAVVAVLGSLRGMRRTHTSALGAQLVLPMHDLAAVLCYAWELMPRETSARLAAAVAAALADGNQLATLLVLLPPAAAEGFRKGRELWQPLLHCTAVAGGLSGSHEARVAAQLLRLEVFHPVTVAPADGSTIRFADPAAVTAALAPAAANNAAARGLRLPSASSSSVAVQAGDGNIDSTRADQPADDNSEALALVSTASLAGSLAATTIGLPLLGIGLALVAVAAASQRADASDTPASKAAPRLDVAAQSSSSSVSSAPASPRTPAKEDRSSSTLSAFSAAPHAAAMGGRTKAVLGGADAAAAACSTAALGSLAVDPDEVVRKIKTQAGQVPLDEALEMVVPLLLLPSDSNATWPLLGLSAVVTSKCPRVAALLGPGNNLALLNMACAAALLRPEGPLAAVMRASTLQDSNSAISKDQLAAALDAAEAVDPHAVAMQLAARLLTSLWQALIGSIASGGSSSAVSRDVSTPEGAADAWQAIVTALLAGLDSRAAAQLLSGFAAQQAGSWEGQLRALAVAAALQDGRRSGSGSDSQLLADVLRQVCAANPLSFLVLLISQHNAVPLRAAATRTVLDAALRQLVSSHGGQQRGSGMFMVGSDGGFDSWGVDAMDLSRALESSSTGSDSEGLQYRSGSRFGSINSGTAVRPAPLPASAVASVVALVQGACARQQPAEAAAYVLRLLRLARAFGPGEEDGEQVLALEEQAQQQLLGLAGDSCLMLLATSQAPADADGDGDGEAALLAQLPELVGALAASGCMERCNRLVAVVCAELAATQAWAPGGDPRSPTFKFLGSVLAAAAAGVRQREGVLSAAKPGGASLLAAAADALFGPPLTVEESLVLLSGVAAAIPQRLGLQLVAAAAGRLHSVMPQAVAIVRAVVPRAE